MARAILREASKMDKKIYRQHGGDFNHPDFPHGSHAGYRAGCRCINCRQGFRDFKQEYMEKFRLNNPDYNEAQRKNKRDFRKTAKGRAAYRNSNAKRRQRVSCSGNTDMNLLNEIYRLCPEGYHVDHIIPLSKGGIHSHINLQYLPKNINLRKGSKENYDTSNHAITWESILVEPATTIPEVGVHSSEWKRRASQVDDDIVFSCRKL